MEAAPNAKLVFTGLFDQCVVSSSATEVLQVFPDLSREFRNQCHNRVDFDRNAFAYMKSPKSKKKGKVVSSDLVNVKGNRGSRVRVWPETLAGDEPLQRSPVVVAKRGITSDCKHGASLP